MMPKWKSIIIHHSATDDDNELQDWDGIKKFHTSWRLGGKIISKAEGKKLLSEGKPVLKPWADIGYHWGLELINNKLVFQRGRSLTQSGAHCIGMNNQSIGICCVGNFDKCQPSEAMYFNCAQLCCLMIKQFPAITPWEIYPHKKFAIKTCPGVLFDMSRLIKYVKYYIGGV